MIINGLRPRGYKCFTRSNESPLNWPVHKKLIFLVPFATGWSVWNRVGIDHNVEHYTATTKLPDGELWRVDDLGGSMTYHLGKGWAEAGGRVPRTDLLLFYDRAGGNADEAGRCAGAGGSAEGPDDVSLTLSESGDDDDDVEDLLFQMMLLQSRNIF